MIEYVDCGVIAESMKDDIRKKLNGGSPTLLIVRAGNNRDDEMYLRGLRRDAEELGISIVMDTGDTAREKGLDGILTLGNVPYTPPTELDVDGIGGKRIRAVTEAALMIAEKYAHDDIVGGHTTVIGRGIGAEIAREMVKRNATVSICHSKTDAKVLEWLLMCSEIVFCASRGAPFSTSLVSSEALVIDIGYGFEAAHGSSRPEPRMTPRKNGVGVVTRAVLLNRVADNYVKRVKEA